MQGVEREFIPAVSNGCKFAFRFVLLKIRSKIFLSCRNFAKRNSIVSAYVMEYDSELDPSTDKNRYYLVTSCHPRRPRVNGRRKKSAEKTSSLRSKRLSNIVRAVLGNAEGARSTREREARAASVSLFLHRAPKITQAPAMQAKFLRDHRLFPDRGSTAVKRLGQFFVLFRKISFTMKWKHEQGYI